MVSSGIPVDKATLLSTLLEGILYGFSLFTFWGTIYTLLSRRFTRQVNRKLLVVTCSLLLWTTVHFVIDIIRLTEGLILYRDTYSRGSIAFFSDLLQWTFVSKNFVYVVQSLIGDGVILYCCYDLWQSNRVMILPGLLWCATAGAGFGVALKAMHVVVFKNLVHWLTTFYTLTFVTCLLTTSLLVYRVWYLQEMTKTLGSRSTSHLGRILHIAAVTILLSLCRIGTSLRSDGGLSTVAIDTVMPVISILAYIAIMCGEFNPLNARVWNEEEGEKSMA